MTAAVHSLVAHGLQKTYGARTVVKDGRVVVDRG